MRVVARWTIAVVCGTIAILLAAYVDTYVLNWSPHVAVRIQLYCFNHGINIPHWAGAFLTFFSFLVPSALLGSAVAVSVYHFTLQPAHEGICRCRKCGYILKGLSKLECSECGEVI